MGGPYLCRFCGHCLTIHARLTSRCQVLGCLCTGLSLPEGTAAAPPSAAQLRETYLVTVREAMHRVDRVAEVEDLCRAAYDAGYCASERMR